MTQVPTSKLMELNEHFKNGARFTRKGNVTRFSTIEHKGCAPVQERDA